MDKKEALITLEHFFQLMKANYEKFWHFAEQLYIENINIRTKETPALDSEMTVALHCMMLDKSPWTYLDKFWKDDDPSKQSPIIPTINYQRTLRDALVIGTKEVSVNFCGENTVYDFDTYMLAGSKISHQKASELDKLCSKFDNKNRQPLSKEVVALIMDSAETDVYGCKRYNLKKEQDNFIENFIAPFQEFVKVKNIERIAAHLKADPANTISGLPHEDQSGFKTDKLREALEAIDETGEIGISITAYFQQLCYGYALYYHNTYTKPKKRYVGGVLFMGTDNGCSWCDLIDAQLFLACNAACYMNIVSRSTGKVLDTILTDDADLAEIKKKGAFNTKPIEPEGVSDEKPMLQGVTRVKLVKDGEDTGLTLETRIDLKNTIPDWMLWQSELDDYSDPEDKPGWL